MQGGCEQTKIIRKNLIFRIFPCIALNIYIYIFYCNCQIAINSSFCNEGHAPADVNIGNLRVYVSHEGTNGGQSIFEQSFL